MECCRRLSSLLILVSFEEKKQCKIVRKIKVLAMVMTRKMVLPFLVCLLSLVYVTAMLQKNVSSPIDSSPLALSNSTIHGMASARSGFRAWLPSLLSSLLTKTSNNVVNWINRLQYDSSTAVPPTPSAFSEASLPLYSASSASVQTFPNESKEIMSCPPSCFRPKPVCGTDGNTYWCGSVDAECAGVEVDYEGFCDFDSKGTGVKGVLAIQSLLLVHMVWLMLAAFLVFLGVI